MKKQPTKKRPPRNRAARKSHDAAAKSNVPAVDPRWALLDPILARIAGGETLRAVCRELCEKDPAHPSESTVRYWYVQDQPEGFAARYASAREAQAEAWSDVLLEVADDGTNDTYLDDNGNRRTDHDVVNRSRLRVDTRKWLMARLHPRAYGEKVDVTSGGAAVPAVGVLLGPQAIEERQQRRAS